MYQIDKNIQIYFHGGGIFLLSNYKLDNYGNNKILKRFNKIKKVKKFLKMKHKKNKKKKILILMMIYLVMMMRKKLKNYKKKWLKRLKKPKNNKKRNKTKNHEQFWILKGMKQVKILLIYLKEFLKRFKKKDQIGKIMLRYQKLHLE